ncbi:MAG TPA: hypothetical protein VKS60_06505 [Stellaceae bacterium]|nr:hypothetical protein [Stellaceae bacterium]
MRFSAVLVPLGVIAATAAAAQAHHPKYDYPTAARADYVIGCLASNGFKREMLQKCSCGIDTIADMMSYDDYDYVNTVLGLQQGGLGERGAVFSNNPVVQPKIDALHKAEAEVNLRCK